MSRGERAAFLGPDSVRCLLCGRVFRVVGWWHLTRAHRLKGDAVGTYKRRFGLEYVACRSFRRGQRRTMVRRWARQGRAWTRTRVLAVIRARRHRGLGLSQTDASDSLRDAALRHFGGWRIALKRAGLDPVAHRRWRQWSAARVIEAIRQRHRRGESLFKSDVLRSDSRLVLASHRYFRGSWLRAVRAAGFDPAEHRKPQGVWTLDRARTWIRERAKAGGSLRWSDVPADLRRWAGKHGHGGWSSLVESSGVRYPGRRNRRDWTNAKVLAEIRARHRAGKGLHVKLVQREGGGLWAQARNRFGSWDRALAKAGIPPARIRRIRPPWTPNEIVAALRRRARAGLPVVLTTAGGEMRRLYSAAVRSHPGGWRGALKAAGIDPASRRRASRRR